MNKTKKSKKHNWLHWLILLVIVLFLALWLKSCSTINNDPRLCSNSSYSTKLWQDTVILDEVSLEKLLLQDIKKTGNLNSLQGLECLEELMILDDGEKDLKDISAIKYLPNLKKLYLDNTDITDITSLNGLSELKELTITNIDIPDLTILDNLNKLTWLNLSNTNIKDIAILNNFKSLEYLDISGSFITDISPLYNLSNLEYLQLRDTAFSRLWYGTEINNDLDSQLRILQTNQPDLEIRFAQAGIINNNDNPFGNWTYHLNYLDLLSFL